MSVLHPAGFIETEGCKGPRLLRNQPSRETMGVLLEDKYITEFTIPYRNVYGLLKSLKLNWNLLDEDQKKRMYDIIGKEINPTVEQPVNKPLEEILTEPENIKKALNIIQNPQTDGHTRMLIQTEYNDWFFRKYWFLILVPLFLLVLILCFK